MNEHGVLTTYEEKCDCGVYDYRFPTFEGTFNARLDCRAWPQKSHTPILMCCFTLEDGRKIKLGAIRRGSNTIYTAKQSDIDAFKDMEDDTWWRVTIKRTSNGHFGWEDVERIEA